MHNQKGSTLVVSLVLLTIITLVAVYALEGSNIQAKMVANSLFSTLTYQECRNEQEVNIHYYNVDSGNRNELIQSMINASPIERIEEEDLTRTELYTENAPKSDLTTTWAYVREAPAGRSGFNVDSESQSRAYLFDHNCTAKFRFSTNSQTLGAIVEGLEQAGAIN